MGNPCGRCASSCHFGWRLELLARDWSSTGPSELDCNIGFWRVRDLLNAIWFWLNHLSHMFASWNSDHYWLRIFLIKTESDPGSCLELLCHEVQLLLKGEVASDHSDWETSSQAWLGWARYCAIACQCWCLIQLACSKERLMLERQKAHRLTLTISHYGSLLLLEKIWEHTGDISRLKSFQRRVVESWGCSFTCTWYKQKTGRSKGPGLDQIIANGKW